MGLDKWKANWLNFDLIFTIFVFLTLFSKKLGDIKITPIFPKKDKKASRVIISGVRDSKKPLTYNQGLILTNKDGKIPKKIDRLLRNGIGFND